MESNVLFAFSLTAIAGLSTGIGSALAFVSRRTNKTFLSGSLGFSAGVMIYVSFVEIMRKATDALVAVHGELRGSWLSAASFFGGIFVIMLIDLMVPSGENPHHVHTVEEMNDPSLADRKLMRAGTFTAIAIAIHNFPEGLATFAAALADPELGIAIAVAIAIHNIPEGISVSVPVYYATGSRKKAFWLSFLSGASEPLGALVGYLLLRSLFTDNTFGILFGMVAGIMVYVSLDELLPAAREYGRGHVAIAGLIAGMAVMALSLLFLM